MNRVNAAFTLIEIMIVVVIIGIAAAMAVPMISSGASFQIRSAANLVVADLEYAKSMAISRGQSYKVVFDAANESYQILKVSDDSVVRPPDRNCDTMSFPNENRIHDVVIDSTSFTAGAVTFDYLGSPDAGGTVVLKAGEIARTITIEPVTGFISVSE
jgi:prepilin-type N-terminal cleavage/methylation domain-containing protein